MNKEDLIKGKKYKHEIVIYTTKMTKRTVKCTASSTYEQLIFIELEEKPNFWSAKFKNKRGNIITIADWAVERNIFEIINNYILKHYEFNRNIISLFVRSNHRFASGRGTEKF